MDEGDVEMYVERSKAVIESSPQMNEQNTKAKLIRPLIELLGWDMYSSEVELEYSMQIGRGNTRADYALLIEGAPVVFIEAKGCDTTLSDTERSQLKSYMRQTGVDWGLLTNGKVFEILKRRTDAKRPDEVTIGTPSLSELVDKYELLELLSKELVESGEAGRIAKRMEATKRAIETLQDDKEEIAECVTQVVMNELGDVPAQDIQTVSKVYVDNLIDSLGANKEIESTSRDESSDQTSVSADNNQYTATLYEDEVIIESFSAETQSSLMASVADFLVEKRGLIDRLESLPYIPGKEQALVNTEPKHPSGDEMRMHEELSGGYCLHTALNKSAKKRYLREFSELCGLTIGFNDSW